MEPVETINQRLERDYGKLDDLRPYWRVVWSEDQFEKRLTNFTAEGFELIHPEVRELRKYPYDHNKYILEMLTEISVIDLIELPTSNGLSYEPRWVFQDKYGNALPPRYDFIELIIKTIHDKIGYKGKRYKDPYSDPKTALEVKEKEIKDLEGYLYGNETPVGDALAYREGVGYTKGPLALPKNATKDN